MASISSTARSHLQTALAWMGVEPSFSNENDVHDHFLSKADHADKSQICWLLFGDGDESTIKIPMVRAMAKLILKAGLTASVNGVDYKPLHIGQFDNGEIVSHMFVNGVPECVPLANHIHKFKKHYAALTDEERGEFSILCDFHLLNLYEVYDDDDCKEAIDHVQKWVIDHEDSLAQLMEASNIVWLEFQTNEDILRSVKHPMIESMANFILWTNTVIEGDGATYYPSRIVAPGFNDRLDCMFESGVKLCEMFDVCKKKLVEHYETLTLKEKGLYSRFCDDTDTKMVFARCLGRTIHFPLDMCGVLRDADYLRVEGQRREMDEENPIQILPNWKVFTEVAKGPDYTMDEKKMMVSHVVQARSNKRRRQE